MSLDIDITVDTTQAEEQLEKVDEFSKQTALKVVGLTRQLYDTVIISAEFMGQAIDQSYQLMAQGVFTAAETLIAINAAYTAGTFGTAEMISGGLGLVGAAALFVQGYQLLIHKDQSKKQMDNLILLGRLQQINTLANIWRIR